MLVLLLAVLTLLVDTDTSKVKTIDVSRNISLSSRTTSLMWTDDKYIKAKNSHELYIYDLMLQELGYSSSFFIHLTSYSFLSNIYKMTKSLNKLINLLGDGQK